MGAPMHHIRDVIRKHRIATFSSNYALYGDEPEADGFS